MAGSPTTLNFVTGGHFGCIQNVFQRLFDQVEHVLIVFMVDQCYIEAGLASHRADIDNFVRMVAGQFGHQVLKGMQRRHFHVRLVRLGDTQIVFVDTVAVDAFFDTCKADIGSFDLGVIQVEAFDVHGFFLFAHAEVSCSDCISENEKRALAPRDGKVVL
ncbi:nicotinic acid phosphoribosyltransferase [Zymobacter palmae]|uniref:Nicotinic acid phosphoribosyltransferase n=1 Tax=Zymobacter palmae TaxID=33074 RepID=A0A348HDX3_9GAMM|nr:nicotinic acid phosphoribosyltransferase [Zymobacter palmae]